MRPIHISICIILLVLITDFSTVRAQSGSSIDSILFSGQNIRAQINEADIVLPTAAVMPSFPGGKPGWINFIRNQFDMRVPFSNKIKPGTYRVIVRFVVGRDSTLRDIGSITNCGYGLEAEMIRIARKSPKWLPARTASGEPVSVPLRQVVTVTATSDNLILQVN